MGCLREAVAAGADIIVAEGCEAGGHSGHRGAFTRVPEAADNLARPAPDTVLVAAGGVADGRGLAAALMLGAEGVLVGTRFFASCESEAPETFRQAIIRDAPRLAQIVRDMVALACRLLGAHSPHRVH